MMIGYTPSPWFFTKDILIVGSINKDCRLDLENVYRWDAVKLNLPGMKSYKPTLPWVFKGREDGSIVVYLYFYIDDGRPTVDNV